MSKHNAVTFLQAGGADAKLAEKLAKADRNVESWLRIATEAGFELTPTEIKAVAEKILGAPISGDPVQALTDDQLDAAAGGFALSASLMNRVGALAEGVINAPTFGVENNIQSPPEKPFSRARTR